MLTYCTGIQANKKQVDLSRNEMSLISTARGRDKASAVWDEGQHKIYKELYLFSMFLPSACGSSSGLKNFTHGHPLTFTWCRKKKKNLMWIDFYVSKRLFLFKQDRCVPNRLWGNKTNLELTKNFFSQSCASISLLYLCLGLLSGAYSRLSMCGRRETDVLHPGMLLFQMMSCKERK